MEIVADESLSNVCNIFTKLISSPDPVWISRIGGSDYNCYKLIFENFENYKEKSFIELNEDQNFNFNLKIISMYNGYFDFDNKLDNKLDNIYKSSQIYIESVLNSDFATLGGPTYWEIKKNDFIYSKFVKEYTKDKNIQCSSYTIIESVSPFLNSFKIWGNNKKILIVSPFEETIKYQTQPDRINKLLNNYEFPNCEFLTYKTPITYNEYNKSNSNYFVNVTKDYNNWIELSNKMVDDISKIDFDIAFISAGGYTMHLGNEIKKMGKKSIYIGGVLNVFFNIYGRRYDNDFYNSFQNLDYRVKCIDDFDDMFKIEEKCFKSEALNAYF